MSKKRPTPNFDCPAGEGYCQPHNCGFLVAPNPTICETDDDCKEYAKAGIGTCLVGRSNMLECYPRANPAHGTSLRCIPDPDKPANTVCSYDDPARTDTMPSYAGPQGHSARNTFGAHHQIQ